MITIVAQHPFNREEKKEKKKRKKKRNVLHDGRGFSDGTQRRLRSDSAIDTKQLAVDLVAHVYRVRHLNIHSAICKSLKQKHVEKRQTKT
jgi:hypothetical protein